MSKLFHSPTRKMLVFLLLLAATPVFAQQIEWNVGTLGFFDNSEGDHTYRITQTYAGTSFTPEVGVSFDDGKHRLMGGINLITRWGANEKALSEKLVLYYQYQNPTFHFLLGNFQRDKLLGEYSDYLIADTIRYYRPIIQGMAAQYIGEHGHFEAFLDWTSAISRESREQFMAGLSTKFHFGHMLMGAEGYYYHYALRHDGPETEHIHDYLIAHPFVGLSFEHPSAPASLEVRAGMLASFDRERALENGSHIHAGFLGEVRASWKRLELKQDIYAGANLQPFGNAHFGQYYWGDTFTQASFYSRTDLRYRFIQHRFANVYGGIIVSATRYGVHHHQVITLSLDLGSKHFKPIKFK